jgi:hypothetical protein
VSVGPGALKIAGGVGALLVCGGAGVTVAADQRPAAAPLKPPVGSGATASAATAANGGLVIPPTPVCAATGTGAGRVAGGQTAAPAIDPQLRAVLAQLAKTPAGPARRQLLAGLTADQRQQITALVQQRQAATRQKGAGAGASCRSGASTATSSVPSLTPSVGDAGPSDNPITFSYVS